MESMLDSTDLAPQRIDFSLLKAKTLTRCEASKIKLPLTPFAFNQIPTSFPHIHINTHIRNPQ